MKNILKLLQSGIHQEDELQNIHQMYISIISLRIMIPFN